MRALVSISNGPQAQYDLGIEGWCSVSMPFLVYLQSDIDGKKGPDSACAHKDRVFVASVDSAARAPCPCAFQTPCALAGTRGHGGTAFMHACWALGPFIEGEIRWRGALQEKHWFFNLRVIRVTPVPSCGCAGRVRGVHLARGLRPQADGWGRDRRIQTILTMFSKRSEPFKGLIATHLWTYLVILEVRSRERRPRRGGA